jgi:glutamate synthase domain-containing protein 1
MNPTLITTAQRPGNNGLYHPAFEHDACGVGMICDLNNRKSHTLVQDALQILVNLTHRGACGCDETTGDGAGILIQKPHRFLEKAARKANIHLPVETDYAAGLVFLPQTKTCRRAAQSHTGLMLPQRKG